MVIIDCPCCEADLSVETPLPDLVGCQACRVSFEITEPEPAASVQIAA